MKRTWHNWLAAGCWLAATVLLVIVGSRRLVYWAGCRNEDVLSTMQWFFASAAAALLLMLVGSFLMAMRFRQVGKATRWLWVALVLLGLVSCPGSSLLAPMGFVAYERGIQHWISQELDMAAIRTWMIGQSPVTSPTPIPPASWPAMLAKTKPESVDDLPGGGVVIIWGQFGTWSSQRQLFIGTTGESERPGQVKWGDRWQENSEGPSPWKQLQPGVYLYVFSGG